MINYYRTRSNLFFFIFLGISISFAQVRDTTSSNYLYPNFVSIQGSASSILLASNLEVALDVNLFKIPYSSTLVGGLRLGIDRMWTSDLNFGGSSYSGSPFTDYQFLFRIMNQHRSTRIDVLFGYLYRTGTDEGYSHYSPKGRLLFDLQYAFNIMASPFSFFIRAGSYTLGVGMLIRVP